MLTGYSKYTAERISSGHVMGGYKKLKQAYPEKMKEIEQDLENNFTREGLDIYRKRMIKGLQAVGAWDE